MIRTFEYDDYPIDRDRLLSVLDGWREAYPGFKANVFAIPSMMTDSHWQPLLDRAEWIQVGIHGFEHIKGECRRDKFVERNRKRLDKVIRDSRYSPIFKAPWYGYSPLMIAELASRGLVIAAETLYGWPHPIPEGYKIWCRSDARRLHPSQHILGHPVQREYSKGPARKQSISEFRVRKWSRTFSATDQWAYCSDLSRPALLKLNLGCEKDVWDGWVCMDNRQLRPEIVQWSFDDMLPYGDCTADVILTSHTLQHIAAEDYAKLFLELWRVLRPQGVLRMHQDDSDSGYVWRKVGSKGRVVSRIGAIKSVPSKSHIIKELERVGFEVYEAEPGVTKSKHKDVLRGDNRMTLYTRGHKFYVEAIKPISLHAHRNAGSLRREDKRATINGRYRLIE